MNASTGVARASLYYGLIYGLANAVFFFIGVLSGVGQNDLFSYLSYALVVGLLIYILWDYRKSQDVFTLKSAIGLGTLSATVGGFISGLVSFIYFSFDNSFLKEIKDKAIAEMYEKNPEIADEAVEMASKMMDMTISPTGFLVMAILGSLFMGLIGSFIIGLFLRKGE